MQRQKLRSVCSCQCCGSDQSMPGGSSLCHFTAPPRTAESYGPIELYIDIEFSTLTSTEPMNRNRTRSCIHWEEERIDEFEVLTAEGLYTVSTWHSCPPNTSLVLLCPCTISTAFSSLFTGAQAYHRSCMSGKHCHRSVSNFSSRCSEAVVEWSWSPLFTSTATARPQYPSLPW